MSGPVNLSACAADWQWRAKQYTILSGSGTKIAAADPTRWALMISFFGQAHFLWPEGAPNDQYSPGFILTTYTYGNAVLEMTFEKYGAVVQTPWYAAARSGSDVIGVLEILYRPSARENY